MRAKVATIKHTYDFLMDGLKKEVLNLKIKQRWRSSWASGKHKLTWRNALDSVFAYYADGGAPMDADETALWLSVEHDVDERTARKAMDLYGESLPGISRLWDVKNP